MKVSQFLWRLTLAFLAVVIVAEVVVRLFVTSPASSEFDRDLEWVYRPNAKVFKATEGGARLTLDQFGLNNDPFDPDDKRKRVLVIGDSFTMAAQVPRSDNYVSMLEQKLNCYNFINAGRDAFQPYEFRIMYDRLKPDIKPAMVLLSFNKNDVLGVRGGLKKLPQPDGSIQYEPKTYKANKTRQFLDPVLNSSALMTILMRRLKSATEASAKKPKKPKEEKMPPDKIELLDHLLRDFKKEVDLRILFVPFLRYNLDRQAVPVEDTEIAWRALKAAADKNGIPIASVSEAFQEEFRRTGQPPVGHPNHVIDAMHMNPRGHQAAANTASELFQECDK